MLSERERTETFLDKINEIRNTHTQLISDDGEAIETVVSFLKKSQPIEELILISESVNNLVSTTKRLIQ